ncbi:MAG: hypothetical protein R3A52_22890 [Polyangiales bacterium]
MKQARAQGLSALFHRLVWMMAVAPVAGCGSTVITPEQDAGGDVSTTDTAPPTDVVITDRAQPVDAGPYDAGQDVEVVVDVSPVDTGPRDVPPVDVQPIDAGPEDVPPSDVGPIDVVLPDTGPLPDVSPVDVQPGDGGACDPIVGAMHSGGTCNTLIQFPCGLPSDVRVPEGGWLEYTDCERLCRGPDIFFSGGCQVTARGDAGDTLSCITCAVGRRPEGFVPTAVRASDLAGEFLARVTELEEASIEAFERLALELAQWGAPTELVDAARAAADDERRHTRAMGALAARRGAVPARAAANDAWAPRALEDLALENAVEGCVRETFGALVATWQSRHAADATAARAFAVVAEDESRHADLAWAVAEWVESRLDASARERVSAARDAAVASLKRELCRPVPSALVRELGLPTARDAAALADALDAQLWAA